MLSKPIQTIRVALLLVLASYGCAGPELDPERRGRSDAGPSAGDTIFGDASLASPDGTDGLEADGSTADSGSGADAEPGACALPWGGRIENGESIDAYQLERVACGEACTLQSRTCVGGVLSGSFAQQACSMEPCTSDCALPWGGELSHGESTDAYETATVPCGSSCNKQTRQCSDGALGGTYVHQRCVVEECRDGCSLPWGGEIADGERVTAFRSATVACGSSCDSLERVCEDGTLTGSAEYAHEACSVERCPTGCGLPWGGTIGAGESVTAYAAPSVACGATCASQRRTCEDSTLSGSYSHETCTPRPCGCELPWGGTIADGQTVEAYRADREACGGQCTSQTRTCDDGALNGTYLYYSCRVDPCPRACELPWGGTIEHGASATAYQAASVGCGESCSSQERVCNDGQLTGSYSHQQCQEQACGSCRLPWGGEIAHAQVVTAYAEASVSCDGQCRSEERTCRDGTLTGNYPAQSCTVATCGTCSLPWGGSIGHGEEVTAYASSGVACGQQCSSQRRSCNDGQLSGSYRHESCDVAPCGCDLPWGGSIGHGEEVTAYASSGVACGQQCSSQRRSCNDGQLSGSYRHQACAPEACSYSWHIGTWGSCVGVDDNRCDTGSRQREVYCRREDGERVANSYCSGSKPATFESCPQTNCYTGGGSCTEVDHPSGSGQNWYCDSWDFWGTGVSGPTFCSDGADRTDEVYSARTELLIGFSCLRD
jgi:hypothetical protein